MRVEFRTPLPGKENCLCPACKFGDRHLGKTLKVCHPEAGGGFTKEHGWTDNIAEDRRVPNAEPLVRDFTGKPIL